MNEALTESLAWHAIIARHHQRQDRNSRDREPLHKLRLMPPSPVAEVALRRHTQSGMDSLKSVTAAFALSVAYWLYSRMWRIRRYDVPPDFGSAPIIYAHWHGDELLLIGAYSGRGLAVMSSWSRDGSIMSRVLTRLGYRVSRGSSTRGGGPGLKGLVDAMKDGASAGLAVDGPRGPLHAVKPGVLKLAQITQCAIVPLGCAARRRYIFRKAWNKCYLPLPFSRCAIVYGSPMRVAPDATDEELEASRRSLQEQLLNLAADGEKKVMGG